MTHTNYSDDWEHSDWKKFQKIVFRLQRRIFKAVREKDTAKARRLQKLILTSYAARMLAIRQVTQLNTGKKTAGIDGKKSLTFYERFQLEKTLKKHTKDWQHQGLREIPIPKKRCARMGRLQPTTDKCRQQNVKPEKSPLSTPAEVSSAKERAPRQDGSIRLLKIPTIADRAWQCLVKYALEPAHEALFHARSYGFRPGRSTHDAQKVLFMHLRSQSNGKTKRVLELDIEKCFDRISHKAILDRIIAPELIISGLRKCLKSGVNPKFPEQGTPQGGVVSPLLANIALNGIENLGESVRYADDMIFILKPGESAERLLAKITRFLSHRGMNVSQKKTKVTASTDGFDFLGWHFYVQKNNGKFRSTPSMDNFKAFRKKVKDIITKSNYDTETKVSKLAPIVRGWRNYHKYCKMDGARFSLWHLAKRVHDVFLQQKNTNRDRAKKKVKIAFPTVSFSENRFVNVKGNKSPFDGDLVYWSKRNSILYGGTTAETLKKQEHSCGRCGLKFLESEKVELHHIDGNHNNWIDQNLMAIHSSCHHYLHMSKSKKPRFSEAG